MVRKFLYLIAILIFLAVSARIAWEIWQDDIIKWYSVPDQPFEPKPKASASTYEDDVMWFARPGKDGQDDTEYLPEGFEPTDRDDVAIFYVHPTSYLKKDHWNAPLDDEESQNRTRIYLRGQASIFNSVGQVWAPRYRQATFGAFLTDAKAADKALQLAFEDVMAAFEVFVDSVPADKPIILAGHSQGSLHLTQLLLRRVADTSLAPRIVATYIIGWPVSETNDLDAMGLPACIDMEQTRCIVSFESFAEPADPSLVVDTYNASIGFDGKPRKDEPILCTNPIWGTKGGFADATDNLGTLVPDEDLMNGDIVPQLVPARCDESGFLFIGPPPTEGSWVYALPGNNYHVYDYSMFWANLRLDVERRTAAFLAGK